MRLQGGIVSSSAIAFLMAVAMTSAGPAGRLLRTMFGAHAWKPLSDLSYSAYLYHELVGQISALYELNTTCSISSQAAVGPEVLCIRPPPATDSHAPALWL